MVLFFQMFKQSTAQNVLITTRFHFLTRKLPAVSLAQKLRSQYRYLHYSVSSTKDNNAEIKIDEIFENTFSNLLDDFTNNEEFEDIAPVVKRLTEVLQYNVMDGKKIRGLLTVHAYQQLCPTEKRTKKNLKLASILGWCVEMVQAFYLIHDDIIDNSNLRRGRPCWYRFNNNGLHAINDAVILDKGVYFLLKKYFKYRLCYVPIIETFQEATYKTTMGQVLDLLTSSTFQSTRRLNEYTLERYNALIKYKTAYYSVHLPICIAMHLAGLSNLTTNKAVIEILLEIGHYFQIQDDYLDCYGDRNKLGKCGTDIQEGKCTWLITTALQRSSNEQKKILQENYGYADSRKIESIKKLYDELDLPNLYQKYEKSIHNDLRTKIRGLPETMNKNVFDDLLEKLYQRQY